MSKKIAFLYPGQGSQAVGMGRELYNRYSVARGAFEMADEELGFSLSKLCFEGPEEQLKLTEYTQPAILTVSVAAAMVLEEHGIRPHVAAGHSLGEYSAHVMANTLSFTNKYEPLSNKLSGLQTVRNRGRYMQEAVPAGQGAMAAILGMSPALVSAACGEAAKETWTVVSPANFNSPEQTVISGSVVGVERAVALCKERGAKRAVMLPVSAPFHCALMQPAQNRLAADLCTLHFHTPQIPVVANVDAAFVESGEAARDTLTRQVTGAVRWVDCMRLLIADGVTHFVEVGPGKVLCGLMRQLDRSLVCLNVEDPVSLEKTLAVLAE